MFTPYELINCVTLSAARNKFTVSGNKLKTIPPSTLDCSGGFYIVKPNAKKPPNFLKVSAKLVGRSGRQCYSSKMSSYMKSSISGSSYLLIQFNIRTIRCEKKRVRNNLCISNQVIFPILIFCHQLFPKEIYKALN